MNVLHLSLSSDDPPFITSWLSPDDSIISEVSSRQIFAHPQLPGGQVRKVPPMVIKGCPEARGIIWFNGRLR